MLKKVIIGEAVDGSKIPVWVADDAMNITPHMRRAILVAHCEAELSTLLQHLPSSMPALDPPWTIEAVIEPDPHACHSLFDTSCGNICRINAVWDWIGLRVPDLVIAIGPALCAMDLETRLRTVAVSEADAIAIERMEHPAATELTEVLSKQAKDDRLPGLAMRRRSERTVQNIALCLSKRYATVLEEAVYIQAMAWVGRLRLGDAAAVEAIAAPYLEGRKQSLAHLTSSHFGGHVLFCELAKRTGKAGYVELARAAADLGFDAHGEPLPAMPLHDEMSDSIFLVCPLLAQVAALTGHRRYIDLCCQHFEFIRRCTRRPDGLHRHSPLTEAAWGRGNGFVALGLAMTMDELSPREPLFEKLLAAFQDHMETLQKHQHPCGMWHQVIDVATSYLELSATCMIAAAIARGLKRNWLRPAPHTAALDRAWHAIKMRISSDGALIDVCAGTGKQSHMTAYLERPALSGFDPRGGAMALLIATELLELDEQKPVFNDQTLMPCTTI